MGVRAWLVESQRRGFLGPGPIEPLVIHSLAFAEAVESTAGGPPDAVLDMGSGGGIPGLVLAERWAASQVTLLEGSARRAAFLQEASEGLGWAPDGRVAVLAGRAETWGRDPAWRERAGVIVARLFGPPAVTVECGAPLLGVGGYLVVSEPPASDGPAKPVADSASVRWPSEKLQLLGLEAEATVRRRDFGFQVLRKVQPTTDRYPRRVGIPAKRPLY